MAFILLVNSDFSSMGWSWLGDMKLKFGNLVDNMTQWRCIPTDLMKSGDDYSNLGHNSEIRDYVELDKINPIYLANAGYAMPGWLYPSQKRLWWSMDLY